MYEHKRILNFFAIFFVCFILCSSLSLSSFAVSNLLNPDMTNSSWSWASWSTYTPTLSYNSSTNTNSFGFNDTSSGILSVRTSSLGDNFQVDDVYRLTFSVFGDFTVVRLEVRLDLYGSNTNQSVPILTIDQRYRPSDNSFTDFSVTFRPSDYMANATRMNLQFDFIGYGTSSTSQNVHIRNVVLANKDDNSGWFQSILDKLNSWSVALNLQLTNLKNGVLDAIGDIQGWLTDVKNGIVNGLTTVLNIVKNAVTNAIAGIQQWFINLGEDIEDFFDMLKDYLLYFQHPVELNEDGVPVDEYGEPIYENIFDIPDFFDTLDGWIEQLETAKSDVDNGANQGIQKLELVITPLSSIISRVPVLTIFLTFALAVIVIKKVIG